MISPFIGKQLVPSMNGTVIDAWFGLGAEFVYLQIGSFDHNSDAGRTRLAVKPSQVSHYCEPSQVTAGETVRPGRVFSWHRALVCQGKATSLLPPR